MPDEIKVESTAPVTVEQPFVLPAKFKGKSAEDIAKAYGELETKLGELGTKARLADEYTEVVKGHDGKVASPKELSQALSWAKQAYAAIQAGELTPKQAAKQAVGDTAAQAALAAVADADEIGDDYDLLSPKDLAKRMDTRLEKRTRQIVEGIAKKYEDQFTGILGAQGSQLKLLVKALKHAVKNPDLDPEELILEAAQLSQKGPEELLEMALNSKLSPKAQKAEVDRLVNERLQQLEQEKEAKRASLSQPLATGRVRFSKQPANRAEEEKLIVSNLKKAGIDLFS